MDNSISIDFESNHKREALTFYWTSFFKNNTLSPICQFDGDKEHRFQEVMDNFDKLEHFVLKHKDGKIQYSVNLVKGLIYIGAVQPIAEEFLKEEKLNIRLIYFRRNTIIFSLNLEQQELKITYFIGFQYNDLQGNNKKILLQIDSLGNVILGDL